MCGSLDLDQYSDYGRFRIHNTGTPDMKFYPFPKKRLQ